MSGPDPWASLARLTPARIGLGRSGVSLPTDAVLRFALAHARARDAVHAPFDGQALIAAVTAMGLAAVPVESDAPDRATYLARPDRGRRLSEASRSRLESCERRGRDVAIVLADGLSARAVHAHGPATVAALIPRLAAAKLSIAPVVLARGARVALGDEVGARLGVRAVIVLIGERPGLSAPDSLGAYLTTDPAVGLSDARRNCVSNIRTAGLSPDLAAFKLVWLLEAAFAGGGSGVALKDESDQARFAPTASHPGLSR